MINIRNEIELQKLREAGRIVGLCHAEIKKKIKPGMTTKDIDVIIEKIIRENNATPSFLNYDGFPGSVCTSINEQVVHGMPSEQTVLEEGDIISIDIGARYKGFHGDSAWTYSVGTISKEKEFLMDKTLESLYAGLKEVKPDVHLSNVSHAIEKIANENNLGIVREMAGHGVGTQLHEDPQILNYGKPGHGPILKEGMVLAIEPMLNLGTHRIKFWNDGWTVTTSDKKPSAHFEHTVVVTKDGYEILTTL